MVGEAVAEQETDRKCAGTKDRKAPGPEERPLQNYSPH